MHHRAQLHRRVLQGALVMLERSAGKLARSVLRGERSREAPDLPGEQAKAGHGQIVGVIGEPGLGKSRLFYEFKLTSQSGCLVLQAFSVSYGKVTISTHN